MGCFTLLVNVGGRVGLRFRVWVVAGFPTFMVWQKQTVLILIIVVTIMIAAKVLANLIRIGLKVAPGIAATRPWSPDPSGMLRVLGETQWNTLVGSEMCQDGAGILKRRPVFL